MITVGQDGSANGLIFYQSSIGGVSLRLFRNNNNAYIIRGGNTNNGITMSPYGKVIFNFTETNTSGGVTEAVVSYPTQTAWNLILNQANTPVRTFYVQGNGDVWHCGLHTISDERFKSNITELDKQETIIKINKLKAVSYNLSQNAGYGSDSVNSLALPNVARSNSKKDIGLLAQDLEKVYPELVSTTETGVKAINYLGLIPVLLNAIQVQSSQISDLQTEIAKLKSSKSTVKSGSETNGGPIQTTAWLEQNSPNPFSESTTIGLFVPNNTAKASLYIYDLTGNQKDVIEISLRGQSSVIIEANSLTQGMYLYSLICDGVLVATKQMILTN